MTSPLGSESTPPQEPVLTTAAWTALATMIIDVLVFYGIPIAPELKTVIVGILSIVALMVHGVIARSKVFSPATVAQMEADFHAASVPVPPPVNPLPPTKLQPPVDHPDA
jgi:hypothetical protein